MAEAKLNPSLFDKLTLNDRVTGIVEEGRAGVQSAGVTQLRLNPGSQIERYNEAAMRVSVRRELGWLLNTVNLGAVQDLSRYPEVKTSVLNYGMPDLTGRISSQAAVTTRANEIAAHIRVFEPRLDASKLQVTAEAKIGVDNAVSYMIRGDITSAVRAMPVQFIANIEVETGEAVVRE
jgi:type VI secretion system protein ImpF